MSSTVHSFVKVCPVPVFQLRLSSSIMFIRHHSIVFAALIAFEAQSISSASLNVDVAIIIHDSAQWLTSLNELTAIKTTLRQDLAKVFDLGDDKSRVAIVATNDSDAPCSSNYGDWSVFAHLTGNQALLETALDAIKSCWTRIYLAEALTMVRKQVFTGEAKRPRVIVVFSVPDSERGMLRLENEVKPLRDSGVLTFIVFQPLKNPNTTNDRYKEFLKVAGSPSNIFNATNFATDVNEQLLQHIKAAMNRELCRYETKCFYADKDRKKCEKASYTPSILLSMGQAGACEAVGLPPPASTSESCQSADCEKVCDELWPWLKPEPNCCGNTNVSRVGERRWKNLEFCRGTYMHKCPPCGSTSATLAARRQMPSDSVVDQPWFIGALCLTIAVVLAAAAIVVIFVKV